MTTENLDVLVERLKHEVARLATAPAGAIYFRKTWAIQAAKEIEGEMAFLIKAAESIATAKDVEPSPTLDELECELDGIEG